MDKSMNDLPKSKKSALVLNERFYFTGIMCTRGHISTRNTKNARCTECVKYDVNKYFIKNRERLLLKDREKYEQNKIARRGEFRDKYEKNKDFYLNKTRMWRINNSEFVKIKDRDRQKKNSAKCAAYSNRRRAEKIKAMPFWADIIAINKIYSNAKKLESIDGIKRHVDHIVPLKGKLVCGLHIPNNLQILTAQKNMEKGNKYVIS